MKCSEYNTENEEEPITVSALRFIKKYLFLFLVLVLIITSFTRQNYRSVREIVPEVLNDAIQYKINDARTLKFDRHGYRCEVLPLYEYEVNGLVVAKLNHKLFDVVKFDRAFPYDLCLIWGSNIASGLYKKDTLVFSPDALIEGRKLNVTGTSRPDLNWDNLTYSHLVINDPKVENKIKSLVLGDQIKIKGKLVNIKANLMGRAGSSLDYTELTWNSGIDNPSQKCKLIYVEDVKILKKANVVSDFLFHTSLYGLLALIIWKIFCFFRSAIT